MTPSEPIPLNQRRRTSPWTVGVELAGLVGLLPLLAVMIATGFGPEVIQIGIGALVLLVRAVAWWFRTYTVTETHLELDEGILNRRHRVVPYSRVQQIDIRQPLIQRFLGVASLHIETAGEGGAKAIVLRVISRDEAEALRTFVLQRRDGTPLNATAAQAAATPLLHIRPRQVFLAGVTEVSSALAFGAVCLTVALVLTGAGLLSVALGGTEVPLAVGFGFLVVTLAVAAIVLLGAAGYLVQNWDFYLSVVGEDLHVRRGLLQVHEQSIPRARVQQASVIDNPLRRAVGIVSIVLHSAAPPDQTRGQGDNDLHIPLVQRAEVEPTLVAVLGPAWAPPPLQPRSSTARRRAILRRCIFLVIVTAPTVLFLPAVLLGIPWGRTAHRRAGFGATASTVGFASGVLHHRLDLVPRTRIQSSRTTSSPFQRRLGLRTLWLDVAGTRLLGPFTRSPHLHDLTDEAATSGMHSLEVRPPTAPHR